MVDTKAEEIEVKCPLCGYAFKTKSELGYVGCSNCNRKFARLENRIIRKPSATPKDRKLGE